MKITIAVCLGIAVLLFALAFVVSVALTGGYALYDVASEWVRLMKRTIARFARWNISAQNGRILFPDEQASEHNRALKFSRKMRERYSKR